MTSNKANLDTSGAIINTVGKATENAIKDASIQRPKKVGSMPEFMATNIPDIKSAINIDIKNEIKIGTWLFLKSIVLAPDTGIKKKRGYKQDK